MGCIKGAEPTRGTERLQPMFRASLIQRYATPGRAQDSDYTTSRKDTLPDVGGGFCPRLLVAEGLHADGQQVVPCACNSSRQELKWAAQPQ